MIDMFTRRFSHCTRKLRLAAKSHLTAIFTAFCYQLTTVAAWIMLKLLHQDYLSLVTALPSWSTLNTIKEQQYYVNSILDSKYSSAALSLRRHWPGNRINGRHFSLPYSCIRGICFVREPTAGIQGTSRGGRIRSDLSGHRRPVLCVDRWSETSHFWNEGDLEWNGRRA